MESPALGWGSQRPEDARQAATLCRVGNIARGQVYTLASNTEYTNC